MRGQGEMGTLIDVFLSGAKVSLLQINIHGRYLKITMNAL